MDACQARKHPEGGQQTGARSEIKTWQRERLSALASQADPGMDMAGKIVGPLLYFLHGMVCKDEGVDTKLVVEEDAFTAVLDLAHDVVVAHDQFERDVAEMFHHLPKYFPFGVIMAVKKIAQANDPFGMGSLDEVH